MIETRNIVRGVFSVWRLAHFDPQGMKLVDSTMDGFWKSFFSAIIVLPGYVALMALGRHSWPGEIAAAPLWRIVAIEGIAYVIAWVAFPLAMVVIADLLDRREHYIGFIVAANWSAVVQIAVFLPTAAVYAAIGNSFALALYILVWSGLFVYAWFIARTAMDINNLAAAGIVGLSFVLDVLIEGIIGLMIASS